MQTVSKTQAELQQDQARAQKRTSELLSESKSLEGRLQEQYQTDAQRRVQGLRVSGSEAAALVRRREELPHDLHAARLASAEIEVQLLKARRAEADARYRELEPDVEDARRELEDVKKRYEQIKSRRDDYAPSSIEQNAMMRAVDSLRNLQAMKLTG